MVILKADDVIPPVAPLAYDILFRPPQLEGMNMWEIMCTYDKSTKNGRTNAQTDDTEASEEEGKFQASVTYGTI